MGVPFAAIPMDEFSPATNGPSRTYACTEVYRDRGHVWRGCRQFRFVYWTSVKKISSARVRVRDWEVLSVFGQYLREHIGGDD